MGKQIVIVGNWKMNKTPAEAKAFMDDFKKLYDLNKNKLPQGIKFGIGAPSVDLEVVSKTKLGNDFLVAAQNVHFKENGAFTGELSLAMIKAVGANAVIIGHSERRAMFNETDADVNLKAIAALKAGITPIICVGETLEEFEANKTKEVVDRQTKAAIANLTDVDLKKIVIAYEPIWAIGTGKTATAEQAEKACAFVRAHVLAETPIQYGGSVKPENIAELLSQPNIDGALVGGASVDANSYIKLLTLNK